jgi:hypothetical protein
MDFSGGQVGFIRMELRAGMVPNSLMGKDLRANMSCKGSKVEKNGANALQRFHN